ncbi:MAG: response regulator transcription factor [Tannerella sp.]|jgi:DNA-binding NarL/FixJ family response regulator|nr:response regulator transcription factor [Tannerella sp.]
MVENRIDVQIVDDHKILAEGLRRIIADSGIANVSALYYDLDSCRRGLTSFRPNVLLLDVELPDGNGVDFCAEIKNLYPDLKIIMLTGYSEFSIAKRSLYNGAHGYVLKNAMPEEIIAGIQTVNIGKRFICKEIERLLNEKKREKIIRLTPREKEVLTALADGFSSAEIADQLFLCPETINGYRKDLLVKFNVKNSVGLVKIAMEQKLI